MQISESCWDPIPGGTFFRYVAQYCQVHVEIDFTPRAQVVYVGGPRITVFYIAEWSNEPDRIRASLPRIIRRRRLVLGTNPSYVGHPLRYQYTVNSIPAYDFRSFRAP